MTEMTYRGVDRGGNMEDNGEQWRWKVKEGDCKLLLSSIQKGERV